MKRTKDANQTAARIVALVTDKGEQIAIKRGKNAAAVALGSLGGKKGGKARALALSPERRSEIARHAAAKRWEDAGKNHGQKRS